ncbi:glycosyltransferase family 4 protein [Vibrio sp. B1Z05]|uniref:glycosyltransferase family 4 protein n=1 Tax=Vibrio sp. B1Z05 TaxID=2654980 RepID=UPI00128C7D41|nr:glycosyltransferase family 4 protein [Vibrio sp. B1Z05]MPW36446.1 glycosyltransferase [Vibrio sp. B1Z05]
MTPNQPTNPCIVFDPIPYHGGSKVATLLAIKQVNRQQHSTCNPSTGNPTNDKASIKDTHLFQRPSKAVRFKDTHFYVLSACKQSWLNSEDTSSSALWLPKGLATRTQGLYYWVKQVYLSLYLLAFTLIIWLSQGKKPTSILLASGPGVDFAGYVVGKLLSIRVIQLIHGPVGKSRAVQWCLMQGHACFYLQSSMRTLLDCLQVTSLPKHFMPFANGLDEQNLPSRHRFSANPHQVQFFWAASLLKWKGLDLLLHATAITPLNQSSSVQVCYIKPQHANLEQSKIDTTIKPIHWHHQPENLDDIRAQSDVYISTSINEPFGLSTLEALFSGLIVVIPQDGAFWDRHLKDGVHCVKYEANNANSLSQVMSDISRDIKRFYAIAQSGKELAATYLAKECYREIVNAIKADPLQSHQQAMTAERSGEES